MPSGRGRGQDTGLLLGTAAPPPLPNFRTARPAVPGASSGHRSVGPQLPPGTSRPMLIAASYPGVRAPRRAPNSQHHGPHLPAKRQLRASRQCTAMAGASSHRSGKWAANRWQAGGKGAARGGKKPAKYQNLAWPGCCMRALHHVVITSSRRIGSWSFYNQLQSTTIFLEYLHGYD